MKNIILTGALFIITTAGSVGAQTNENGPLKVAQASNQGSFQNQSTNQSQLLQMSVPRKSFGRRLLENTTLGYYQQFLGPTAKGPGSETYNVFQEGVDAPGTGRAPLQSFHGISLRHQVSSNWTIGTGLSIVNGYSKKEIENKNATGDTFNNGAVTQFFNARAFVSLPTLKLPAGNIFTTISYEHPTSSISKQDEMLWGWVLAQSFAIKLPDIRWSAGLTGQAYRIYYKNNVKAPPFAPEFGGLPTQLQTMIVSGGPYVNYRFSDFWMLGSAVTFDWDQRGDQTGSLEFNNNLSDRARVSLTYFPQRIKYLQSVGVFTQALLRASPETTAFGADLTIKF
jgi:hypothetical protein